MRLIGTAIVAAAFAGVCFWMAQAAEPPKNPSAELMRKKLQTAQLLLEGLALQDFKKLDRAADDLTMISKRAEWRVVNTPEYSRYSEELRRSCDDIVAAAKKKNIDAATLGYLKLTTTCVECHKHLRETKIASVDGIPARLGSE